MRIQGFHHLAVQVKDLERSVRFYKDLLGLEIQVRHTREDGSLRSVWMALPDQSFIALEACESAPVSDEFRRPEAGLLLAAFRIPRTDRERWVSHFRAQGVDVVHQTRFSFYVRDPEGNRLAFSHHPEDASASVPRKA